MERDWDYTRHTKITRIRYEDDFKGYNRLDKRVWRSLKEIFSKQSIIFRSDKNEVWYKKIRNSFYWRVAMVITYMRTDRHLPDGILDGGCVVSLWEETGEYLQMVQPQVGAMFADWLIAEPNNPHAKKILKELKRVQKAYTARIEAGEVN
jgi:hypothetical protein